MEREPDRVLELFMTSVREAGGAGRMLTDHRTGWLPMLMASACTLLLQEQEHREPQEIADLLGITRDEVENILTGPADSAPSRIFDELPVNELEREQIAGGMVRHAWAQHQPAPPH
jgi:probable regulatory domain-containing protein